MRIRISGYPCSAESGAESISLCDVDLSKIQCLEFNKSRSNFDVEERIQSCTILGGDFVIRL